MVMKTIIFALLTVGIAGVNLLPQNQYARTERKDILKELCQKNGADEKYGDARNAANLYQVCIASHIDLDSLRIELYEALVNSTFNAELFTQYCSKVPKLKICSNSFLDSIAPCTDESIRSYFTAAANAEDKFIEFLCNDDGKKIGKFIREGGLQCIQGDAITSCFRSYVTVILHNMEIFKFSTNDICALLDQFHSCMSPQLRTCKTITASNLLDSIVNIISNNFSCNDVSKS